MGKLSPMMQQYKEIKAQYPDYILFYRIGDFYEMFFEDALTASRELELTLTGRDCGMEDRAPMCGVPYHACEVYLKKLVEKEYKVAICEQMESPYAAKGVVKREVIRITTPGTIVEGSMLPEGENNYLASIYYTPDGYGACFADVSTGEARFTQYDGPDPERGVIGELSKYAPKELLVNPGFFDCTGARDFIQSRLRCVVDPVEESQYDQRQAVRVVLDQFSAQNLEELQLKNSVCALYAVAAMVSYLRETQKTGARRLRTLTRYSDEQFLSIDITARRNLELTETLRSHEKRGSLLWVLDRTCTAMGKRLMRKYLEQPLASLPQITRRHSAVAELADKTLERAALIEALQGVHDLERLMTKVVYGTVTPRELLSLAYTAANLPRVREAASHFEATLLAALYEKLDPLQEMRALIEAAIDEDAPVNRKDGGYIRHGYRADLDEYKDLQKNAKDYLAKIEERERERTGIKNLRVSYNRVFGYYIEVTRSFLSQVPDDYIRKQTLTGSERFITEELKELESKVLYASDRMIALEAEIYDQICKEVAAELPVIEQTAAAVAQLDVLASLAQVAVENGYVRPEFSANGEIRILEGRHPVVEAMFPQTPFVPNDTLLDNDANLVAVITGPNMAGKSTYMRQVALICIMAQMGSFVPAKAATLPILDKVFTRVGASDDLTAGQSTFMVEMSEVAYILQNATPRSLVILDEIGRGTSTFDGMSIAKAVVEYIIKEKNIRAKTLFATHYHELTELENQYHGVVNYNIAVKKRGEEIIFLRKILRGGADESYGIEVARLAGVPDKVIRRARSVMAELEKNMQRPHIAEPPREEAQISFSDQADARAVSALRKMDVDSMSPREALDALYELKALLGNT